MAARLGLVVLARWVLPKEPIQGFRYRAPAPFLATEVGGEMRKFRNPSLIARYTIDPKVCVDWVLEPNHGDTRENGKRSNHTTRRIKVKTPPVIGPVNRER